MWDKLTVEQYQLIHAIQKRDIDPLDKVTQTIAVAYDLTEAQVNDLPVDVFNAYAKSVAKSVTEEQFTRPAKTRITANKTRYRLLYEVGKLRFGQYIELQHFIRGGVVENLHLIAASISEKTKYYFWTEKNSSETHDERANDFLQANFQSLYCSVVFFCSLLASFNKQWNPPAEDMDDEPDPETISPFIQHWGWIYSATELAKHERVKLDDAFNLSTTQALNGLRYIREYNNYQVELNEKAKKKYATVQV